LDRRQARRKLVWALLAAPVGRRPTILGRQ
jgi:hypothetical protein